VEVMVKGRTKRIRIKDVLHVPKLHANLLSVSKILSSGCKVQFNMNECIVRAFDGEVIVIALRDGNLYQVTSPRCVRCMWPTWPKLQQLMVHWSFGIVTSVI
jgi:hypothetical protein